MLALKMFRGQSRKHRDGFIFKWVSSDTHANAPFFVIIILMNGIGGRGTQAFCATVYKSSLFSITCLLPVCMSHPSPVLVLRFHSFSQLSTHLLIVI